MSKIPSQTRKKLNDAGVEKGWGLLVLPEYDDTIYVVAYPDKSKPPEDQRKVVVCVTYGEQDYPWFVGINKLNGR